MRYYTPEEMKKTYKDEVAEIISGTVGKNVEHNFALDIFLEYSKKMPQLSMDAKILDLGTAKGQFLHQLYEAGFKNLYAHDVGDYLPKEARAFVKDFGVSDLNTDKLPWADNFFDAVTVWCVIPHLENPFHCGREIRRVLKPGGMFIFTTPYLASKPSISHFLKTKNFGRYNEANNHIAMLPLSILKKTIFRGFNLVATEYFVHPKIFKGWRGKLRKKYLALIAGNPGLREKFRSRWAYNICYFLEKT